MKRLILALTVAFLFVSGSAFAATINCIMYSSENDGIKPNPYGAPLPIKTNYTFTIETDDITGDVIAFTDLLSDYLYAYSAGGYDARDEGPFAECEQVFPNGARQTVAQCVFDGNTAGTTMWWAQQTDPESIFEGMVFMIGFLSISYDPVNDIGISTIGPNVALETSYVFHAVPIPAAGWLLMSGLVGIVGFRKKFTKEA